MRCYKIELTNGGRVWETLAVHRDDASGLRTEVARFVGELLTDHSEQIWIDEDWRVRATDENGSLLFMLDLHATPTAQ